MKKKRWKAFWFNKKKISLDVSISEMAGKMYIDVIDILTQNGFINVETLPIKDIYVDSRYTPGEVEKVLIDGKSICKQNEMIPYDTKIMVVYHLKKELVFPYSSRQVKKQNCEMLSKELLDIGFTAINITAIKDLRKGWLVKDGSVETVIIDKQESYKRGLLLNYDTEVNIFYHTFK